MLYNSFINLVYFYVPETWFDQCHYEVWFDMLIVGFSGDQRYSATQSFPEAYICWSNESIWFRQAGCSIWSWIKRCNNASLPLSLSGLGGLFFIYLFGGGGGGRNWLICSTSFFYSVSDWILRKLMHFAECLFLTALLSSFIILGFWFFIL